jgi:sodium/bile acid cotransporter 7
MASFLAKHWFLLLLIVGVGAAIAWPSGMHQVTDSWQPRRFIAVAMFLMAFTMPTHSLLAEVRQPWASIWAVVLSYGLVPVAAWLVGYLAPSKDVQIGLILVACVPCTLSAAVLWTRMAGGNEATALLAVMGTTFSSWIITTAWLYWLTGADLQLDVAEMMLDLILSLIVPVVLGQALRWPRAFADYADRRRVLLGVMSQGLVLAVVLKAGVNVGDRLHADNAAEAPLVFLWSVALAVVLHLFALAASFWSCRWLGFERGRQIAVAFSASQKTLQVSLMLYEQYFRVGFPFAVLPMLFYHVGQLLLDTVIARQMAKHLGVAPVEAPTGAGDAC